MKITFTANLDSAAFDVATESDGGLSAGVAASEAVADLFTQAVNSFADRDLLRARDRGTVRDVNGNTVGEWIVSA